MRSEQQLLEANSQAQIEHRLHEGRIGWVGPLLVLTGRSVFMIFAQGIVAGIYLLRGHPSPWNAAAPWWTVYGTLVDLGCLALMAKFTRPEGIRLRDLIGQVRLRWGYDLILGVACFVVFVLAFSFPGFLASKLVFGTTQPALYPGLLAERRLPFWAVIYSFGIWLPIWSPTEEMTYNGYVLPRIQALTSSKTVSVMLVGFWWALQHCFIPFILDWKYVVWRFLFFLPGVLIGSLIYLRIRRLAPLILAHWPMDLMAVMYTLKF
ncbi:MAG TPA: CPBP family glutamic-type intramembrane protease [Candidatus Limnocylindrales bacterium]|nr:CPBP family glutamic-type intramembrane protease [Candidatus Limnocylindrales bacterium]